MKEFDIEKLERKNIYKVPDNLFENIQGKVMSEIKVEKKTPIIQMNWVYAIAAAIALIFGITFVLNSGNDSTQDAPTSANAYASNDKANKTESEIAYETLKADLTSVENNNQTIANQDIKSTVYRQENTTEKAGSTIKPASKQEETQMNEYLDSFTNSEISELANNSTQDVYLDLYN